MAPAGSALYTSQAASDWASSIAFNLPAPHKVERLTGDTEGKQLLTALGNEQKVVEGATAYELQQVHPRIMHYLADEPRAGVQASW